MDNYLSLADPAAILGAAMSLHRESLKLSSIKPRVDLSECYNGGDEFMRQVMRVATGFELWSCKHVLFQELDYVWPYELEEQFGPACLSVMKGPGSLMDFDDRDCMRVAAKLRLPLRMDTGLRVAVDLTAPNPIKEATFAYFRIKTIRQSRVDGFTTAFTSDDDPFDERYGTPYYALYGVGNDGTLEHIADRATFSEVVSLAGKLAPNIAFHALP